MNCFPWSHISPIASTQQWRLNPSCPIYLFIIITLQCFRCNIVHSTRRRGTILTGFSCSTRSSSIARQNIEDWGYITLQQFVKMQSSERGMLCNRSQMFAIRIDRSGKDAMVKLVVSTTLLIRSHVGCTRRHPNLHCRVRQSANWLPPVVVTSDKHTSGFAFIKKSDGDWWRFRI